MSLIVKNQMRLSTFIFCGSSFWATRFISVSSYDYTHVSEADWRPRPSGKREVRIVDLNIDQEGD